MKYPLRLLPALFIFALLPIRARAQCATLPLVYCGVTDVVDRNSTAAPTPGAAGTFTVDPDYGSKVYRITQSGQLGAGANACPDSGSQNYFPDNGEGWHVDSNLDDTKFLIGTGASSGTWWIVNNGVLTGAFDCIPSNKLLRFQYFAQATQNRLFGQDTVNFNAISRWDIGAGSAVQIMDMSTVPGVNWHSMNLTSCDSLDQWCFVTNGGQDTANASQVVMVDSTNTTHTQVLDIPAATSKQNSSAAVALDNLSVAQLANCVIHEASWQNNTWIVISLNSCSAFPVSNAGKAIVYWQIGTNHVTYFPDVNEFASHNASGFGTVWMNSPGQQPPCAIAGTGIKMFDISNPGGSPSNYIQVTNCLNPVAHGDPHLSWLNNKNDANANKYPVIIMPDDGSGPWNEEILAIQTTPSLTALLASQFGTVGGAVVTRLGHTFNDPTVSNCSGHAFISPNVGRTGRFIWFTSDWKQLIQPGTCAGGTARNDVFMLDAGSIGGAPVGPSRSCPLCLLMGN